MQPSVGETIVGIIFRPLPLMMFALMFYMLFMVIRAATARDGGNLGGVTEDGAKVISVKATFAGIRGMPSLVAVATNNASPLFAIGPLGLEYRVIRKHKRSFSEIEMIDVRTARGTVNIEILFRGSVLTLAVNVGTEAAARKVLALFPAATPMTMRARVLSIPEEALQYNARDFTK